MNRSPHTNLSRPDHVWALAMSLIAFSFYIGLLSKAYVFEGLIRAMPIETGRFVHLFPGNYLLYGPLGLMFHLFLKAVGVQIMAVTSLQIMDCLLGAAGIYVYFLLLRRLGGDKLLCIVGCVLLGCSLGYWLWSTEAEDYILSTFLLLINFYALVRYPTLKLKDPVLLGVLHGLAMLGHIVNLVFAPVILWVLYSTHGKNWRSPALKYAAAALVVVVAVYGMVIGVIQKPANTYDAWRWFLGSAGANGPVSGPSALKFWIWLKTTLHIFISNAPDYTNPPAWSFSHLFLWGARGLLMVFLGLLILQRRSLWRQHAIVVGACGVWLAAYACVFTSWQPETMVYRVSDLIPLCTLLFLVIQSVSNQHRGWKVAAMLLALCLTVGNYASEIHPRSYASNNPNLDRMTFLKAHTQEGDWVTGDSGQDEIYIPYFAQRLPIVVARYTQQPERLAAFLKELLVHHQSIYVTSRVLETETWEPFFKKYHLRKTAEDAKGFALYRLES